MSEESGIQTVGIVAKRTSREALDLAEQLADWLARRDLQVAVDEALAEGDATRDLPLFDATGRYDLVVVLGGDGTLLSVARQLGNGTPILGVNLGTLGFLTEIPRSQLYPSLVRVFSGRYRIEDRMLLEVTLRRRSGVESRYQVLNDAVINKSALARIIELTVSVDGNLLANYRSDGLIVSTPTGSTAYNLSAGGPILNPMLPVVALTPICAHSLTQRPIVLPEESLIDVSLDTPREEVFLTLDGQEGTGMEEGDSIRVRSSPDRVRLIKTGGRTFYEGLRDKLHWGE